MCGGVRKRELEAQFETFCGDSAGQWAKGGDTLFLKLIQEEVIFVRRIHSL
jgi:hypothetical protein